MVTRDYPKLELVYRPGSREILKYLYFETVLNNNREINTTKMVKDIKFTFQNVVTNSNHLNDQKVINKIKYSRGYHLSLTKKGIDIAKMISKIDDLML